MFDGTPIHIGGVTGKKFSESGYTGREAILGVENIHLEDSFIAANPQSILEARIELSEMMGAETFVHLSVSGTMPVLL